LYRLMIRAISVLADDLRQPPFALVEFVASFSDRCRGHRVIDRRQFVKRTCLGGFALYLDHWATSPAYSQDLIPPAPPIHVNEPLGALRSPLGMPGLFPGRVIETADPQAIISNRVSQPVIRRMLDRAMRELTGAQEVREAWR